MEPTIIETGVYICLISAGIVIITVILSAAGESRVNKRKKELEELRDIREKLLRSILDDQKSHVEVITKE